MMPRMDQCCAVNDKIYEQEIEGQKGQPWQASTMMNNNNYLIVCMYCTRQA